MRRLRPDDDYFIRLETDATPHHIGSLQFYDLSGRSSGEFFPAVREHFEKRLPATPLLCRHRNAPFGYDADVWVELARCDLDDRIEHIETDHALTRSEIQSIIDERVARRLDLTKPPFKVFVMDRVEGDRAAIFMMIHHSVGDGVSFQNIMALLTDETPTPQYAPPPRTRDEQPPTALLWLASSALRFRSEARKEAAAAVVRDEARAVYRAFRKDPSKARTPTAQLAMAQKTSHRRRFTSMSLPLERMRRAGKALGGTVNDAFLAVATSALRAYLSEVGELPESPLVAVAARSYRKPEHGPFGNRIITLNPALPVQLADPVARFRGIQASMAIELERAALTEPLISEFDKPFGARKRYRDYMKRTAGGGTVIQGNVTLSNVPGPANSVYLAGFEMLANYPAPILGSGRFLNITLRRYRDQLDLGLMTDPEQLAEPERLLAYLVEGLEELERTGSDA